MDVVVSGRHCEVPESFREAVIDKIAKLEKHDQRLIRVEVKVVKQQSRRDPEMKVEITAKSRGPVVRAEASADEKHAALDLAMDKMEAQMRRAASRRLSPRGNASTNLCVPRCPSSTWSQNRSSKKSHWSARPGRSRSPVTDHSSSVRRPTRRRRSPSIRLSMRWNSSVTTSICLSTRSPSVRAWSIAARAMTTA